MKLFYVGVDVGTGSVRAGLFDDKGMQQSVAVEPISTRHDCAEMFSQSSDEIWSAVCKVVKKVILNTDAGLVKGIGFTATCSLVVLDDLDSPLGISQSDDSQWNVILWMDHRAVEQADVINSTHHNALHTVGGKISPEMQLPKVLWLKEKLPHVWVKVGKVLDLNDFLTYKATGNNTRSLCSLVCKWTYKTGSGWDKEFLEMIGLQELAEQQGKIGTDVAAPGCAVGQGLSTSVAEQLGLLPGTAVGTSVIDAYAGTLGAFTVQPVEPILLTHRLALISGTSACHLTLSDKPLYIPGVWGPYESVMIADLWVNEAGQSVAGKLLDHVITSHPAYVEAQQEAVSKNSDVSEVLLQHLSSISVQENCGIQELTKNLHVYPDYHGNRSPLADPAMKGMVSGLAISSDVDNLALLYLAAVQALAYSSRHILEHLREHGQTVRCVHVCGGLSKNQLYLQTHADVLGITVLVGTSQDAVLTGAAMLGAVASGNIKNIYDALRQFAGPSNIIIPDRQTAQYQNKKYRVYKQMIEHQRNYVDLMNSSS